MAWRASGLECKVSVNLDASLVEDTDFCMRLPRLCQEAGIAASWLVYEMTEQRLPNDLSRIIENIARLRMAGFGMALDDFGTGAANFDILRACPFSELKIDRSVVAGAGREPRNREFVEFAVRAAHSEELTVVAEGVETLDEFEFIKLAGADTVQGYYFDRPLSKDQAIERIRRNQEQLITQR